MKKAVVALCILLVLTIGCIDNVENQDNESKEDNHDQKITQNERLLGSWVKDEGQTSIEKVIFRENGNATVYFGCACPAGKEYAAYNIVEKYIDIAAETRTQRYVFSISENVLFLRTLTEKEFTTFIQP